MSEQIKKYTKPAEPIEAVLLTENNVEDVVKWMMSKGSVYSEYTKIAGKGISCMGKVPADSFFFFNRYVVYRDQMFLQETAEYFEKTYAPAEPTEQNEKLTKDQILDQAKDFAYKMAEGKNRLGKNYPVGLMIGYDSGYRQAIKDSGSLIQTYATGEQNEKLTAEDISNVLHAAYLRDGEPTKATVTYLYHLFQSKAAQQVEHATAEAKKETDAVYKEWKERFDDTSTQLVAEKSKTAELKEHIKKLEETAILRVESITIIADGYRKEAAELRKELEELKGSTELSDDEQLSLDRVSNNYHSVRLGIHKDQYATEIYKAFQEGAKWAISFRASWQPVAKGAMRAVVEAQRESAALKTQLAEVQRQRDEYATIIENSFDGSLTTGVSRFGANRIIDLKKQISEANELIESYPNFTNGRRQVEWASKREAYLSRLSSGETKPPESLTDKK